eukprot:COSAG05_NODE_1233_length_5439_cov_3.436891_4_plen_371_part_01
MWPKPAGSTPRPEPLRARAAEQRQTSARRRGSRNRELDQVGRRLDDTGRELMHVTGQIDRWKCMVSGVEVAGAPASGREGRRPARARNHQQAGESFTNVLARAAAVMKKPPQGADAAARQRLQATSDPATHPVDLQDPGEKLRKFKALLDQDLITKADYDRQKEMVLSELGGVPSHQCLVSTAADRAKAARVANAKAVVQNATASATAMATAGAAAADAALEKRRAEQRREKEKMVQRLSKLGLGTRESGFIPALEVGNRHVPTAPSSQNPTLSVRSASTSARTHSSTQVCVCRLHPCVCDGDSDDELPNVGSDQVAAAASTANVMAAAVADYSDDDSLKTDSDWEDDDDEPAARAPVASDAFQARPSVLR